ncbi:uncharacterized protein LOC125678264 isoform X2 [Ostrea edulis]|uniref:uncharacterized protein LOC125678264 isoform X2 n=1 Tax=Ostrea edulis TaxID=37623 RepID=UPI0024AEE53D|nr:uncharacterized protein LOC125678264 isoform X2 [Ostrea edulis]
MQRDQDHFTLKEMEFPFTYLEDIDFLRQVRTSVLDNLNRSPEGTSPEVTNGYLPNERPLRRVFPQGREPLVSLIKKQSCLEFVGFIGFVKNASELDEGIKKEIWDVDLKLIEELQEHANILGYFSAERTDGCNWGNLVVLNSFDAINEWRNSQTHALAINLLSPRFYSKVRIHTGTLKDGFSGDLEVQKTIFIDYESSLPPKRSVVYWKNDI